MFSSLLGRSWWVLSPLDRLLVSLGLLLGPPGELLAASWSLLRRSWGGLGATWVPLGSSWSRSKTTCKNHAKKDQLQDPNTHQRRDMKEGFGEPKIDQNGIQNESKFKTIFKSEKIALQEPLGAVLGRSWGILGAILGLKKSLRYRQA